MNINNVFDTVYIAESNSNIHATASSETWNGVDVTTRFGSDLEEHGIFH